MKMVFTDQLSSILIALQDMQDDQSVPKGVKLKLGFISTTLQENSDMSLRVNKVMAVLDELQENNNLQAFTRTQIYNLASMLEIL